jgi:hypothetical protein
VYYESFEIIQQMFIASWNAPTVRIPYDRNTCFSAMTTCSIYISFSVHYIDRTDAGQPKWWHLILFDIVLEI